MTHTDLIQRLESATEGSRELSDDVQLASGWSKVTYDDGQKVVWRSPEGETFRYEDRPGVKIRPVPDRPSPTESIDAALTLVPEGWDQHGSLSWPGRDNGITVNKARATLHHVLSSGGGPRVTGFGGTPALALCIAALRARLSKLEGEK